jgi:exopolyphosphatase/guanosine-5'-triphosphate,3'-diphosphate pyrophosphatase
MLDRAHILGAAMRVAYVLSAAMPGILPRVPLKVVKNQLVLSLPKELAPLANERVQGRLKTLARIIGREPLIKVR